MTNLEREQLLDEVRHGDYGWPHVKRETLAIPQRLELFDLAPLTVCEDHFAHVSATARCVERLENGGFEAHALQANPER